MNTKVVDGFNFTSNFTSRRMWNATKVVSSCYWSKWTKIPCTWGFPISITFVPTASCNLRCPEYPSGNREFSRPTGMTVDDFYEDIAYLIFHFQGEPFLNHKFLEMANYGTSKNIYTATSTNAHYLNDENARKTIESGLDRLIVSIDGTTQETHEQYRIGGSLKKVIEGTENIIRWEKELKSKTPHIIFQFLVVKANEHQMNDIKVLGKEIGVDEVRFKTAQLYDYINGNKLMPTNEKYSRYKKQSNGTYAIKNKMHNHCWKLWHSSVITWDGLVVPCCFDKDAKHKLGDSKVTSFREVWQSTQYNNFRASVLSSRSEIDICTNCTEGCKVWT